MEYDTYKTFIVLSETLNFSRTAEKLNIVQSTVSNRIQELEKYLGKTLFIRSNRKVELTNAGKTFLPYAQRLIVIEREGLKKLNIFSNYQDYLNIGVIDSIYRGSLAHLVPTYLVKFPAISLKVMINHSDQILQLLTDGVLDVGYVQIKNKSPKLASYLLDQQEIILVTHPEHQKYPEGVASKDLYQLRLLFADLGDGFNEWIFNIFPRNYTFSFHIDQISLIIECLQAKLGFAFVVRSAVQRELLKRELVEVKLVDIHPPTIASYMVINKKRKKAPGVQRWLELIGAP